MKKSVIKSLALANFLHSQFPTFRPSTTKHGGNTRSIHISVISEHNFMKSCLHLSLPKDSI